MTWMIVIGRRLALDRLRTRRREATASEPEELDRLLDGAAAEAEWPETPDPRGRAALARCLEELGDGQQQAIRLAYLEGLSHPELAGRLAVPLGTVKTWLRRGLARLRECLE